jgi:hypothetical protein
VEHPISTCLTISPPKAYQNQTNLVVVEKDIATEIYSISNAAKPILKFYAQNEAFSQLGKKRLCSIKHRIYS